MSVIVQLSPLLVQHFDDNSGAPLSGGLLFAYAAGTLTKLDTYTDSTGGTTNTDPITLNSRGECNCWMQAGLAYKFILSPPGDTDPPTNPIWTVDNILGNASVPSVPTVFRPGAGPIVSSYALPSAPSTDYFILFLDGVEQSPDDYSVVGNILSLLAPLVPSDYLKLMATYV